MQPDLDSAYSLETPADNRKLYADWSDTYDTGFAEDMDYQLPERVAEVFLNLFDGSGPILDVGAGTGLLAQNLPWDIAQKTTALDLSSEMLRVAEAKGLYADYRVGDLTKPLDIPDGTYNAIVSSGTFTHGHVGPEALDELLRIARPDALFVLSVNAAHYEEKGFREKFETLAPVITAFRIVPVKIFGDRTTEEHRDDLGNVVTFRKC